LGLSLTERHARTIVKLVNLLRALESSISYSEKIIRYGLISNTVATKGVVAFSRFRGKLLSKESYLPAPSYFN
jgi:hypothetical protein